MHQYAARSEHLIKPLAHTGVVGGQDDIAVGEQVKDHLVRVAPQRLQYAAQAVLHGQQQLHTARTCAHHGHGRGAGVLLHSL